MSRHWFRATQFSFAAPMVAALLLTGEVRAQQSTPLDPITAGSRVRFQAPSVIRGTILGTVMSVDRESLLVSTDDQRPFRVSRQAISRLEVSTGKSRQALKGMLVGAGIGAVVLGALGGVGTAGSSHGEAAVLGVGVGAAYGVGFGALLKRDRWSSVPLESVRIGLAPTRGKGLGLALSMSF